MANTSSAKKAVRNAAKKKDRNDALRTKVRVARRDLVKAIANGVKKADLGKLLTTYYKQVDKAAKGGRVYSKNKAARLKSSMAKAISA